MKRLYHYTLEDFERLLRSGPILMIREEIDPENVMEDLEYTATLFVASRQGKMQYIYREDHANGSWGETWGDTLLQVFLMRVFGWDFDTCIVTEADHLPRGLIEGNHS